MRRILLIFGVSALTAGLTSCFDSPFSTNATVTLANGSGAAVLTGTTESSGRTSAAFDPNATYAQSLMVAAGAIAGSSAVFPPGALSLAADIFIEEGSNLAGSSAFADLGLGATNAISAAGASVIIRPSVDAALTVPMALSLPLPSGYGLWGISEDNFGMNLLLGESDDRLAILAKVWDPASSSLQTILIPPSEIQNENGKATFKTKLFGAFQTVLMANPVTERVEAKASEPVTNAAGISVVATAGIVNQSSIAVTETLRALTLAGSLTLAYDSETRAAKVTATLSESVATSACTLALRNQGKSDVLWSIGKKEAATSASQQISAIIPASVAGTIEAAISCNAVDGRSVKSSWAYLGKVCGLGFFGANCVACAAGTYPSNGSCVAVGTGNYSANGLDRFQCSNVPSNAGYSTNNSTSATCPWSCNVDYLLNAAETGCDYRPNTQTVSCPSGQVIVGAAVRSGGWMDNLGVRCQTFTNGALTGEITDGPAYGGTGGEQATFGCTAGSYLYRNTGGNFSYLGNIKFYCRSLTTDLLTDTSPQYGSSDGETSFDYSCPGSAPITSILIEPVVSFVGPILQANCGSNLK